jgi:hypothetical protein
MWLFNERWPLFRPSTRRLFREGGWSRLFNLQSIHGYVYLRWTSYYVHLLVSVLAPVFKTRAVDWLADRYHGKVVTHELAKAIITVKYR